MATFTVDQNGAVSIEHEFKKLDSSVAKNVTLDRKSSDWLARYQSKYCAKVSEKPNCLDKAVGKTAVDLIAEELEIRRFETNIGAYIADTMVDAFSPLNLPAEQQPQIALINSGSLRLNQNIPAGAINHWQVNGLFQYEVPLVLTPITGKQLIAALNHSIENWTGTGWYLQVSGVAFKHNVAEQKAEQISLVNADGTLTLVTDTTPIMAVLGDYIANPAKGDQDGYTMFNLDNAINYGPELELKARFVERLSQASQDGKAINPSLPDRVCNTERPDLNCIL